MEPRHIKFFVGGLPGEVKKRKLKVFFSQFGQLKKITTYNPHKNQKMLGYCFVYFDKLEDDTLLDKSKKLFFNGRVLQIEPAVKNMALKQNLIEKHEKRIYIPNIPLGWTDHDIITTFSRFGQLENAFLVTRPARTETKPQLTALNGIPGPLDSGAGQFDSTKYGFVFFEDAEVAKRLVALKEIKLHGSGTVLQLWQNAHSRSEEDKASINPKMIEDYKANRKLDSKLQATVDLHMLKPTDKLYHQWHEGSASFIDTAENYRLNKISGFSTLSRIRSKPTKLSPFGRLQAQPPVHCTLPDTIENQQTPTDDKSLLFRNRGTLYKQKLPPTLMLPPSLLDSPKPKSVKKRSKKQENQA